LIKKLAAAGKISLSDTSATNVGIMKKVIIRSASAGTRGSWEAVEDDAVDKS